MGADINGFQAINLNDFGDPLTSPQTLVVRGEMSRQLMTRALSRDLVQTVMST